MNARLERMILSQNMSFLLKNITTYFKAVDSVELKYIVFGINIIQFRLDDIFVAHVFNCFTTLIS